MPGLGHVSVSLIFWETINVLPGPSFSRKISDNGIFLRGFEVSGEISLVPEDWIEVCVLVELRTVRIMTQGDSNLRPLWQDQQP